MKRQFCFVAILAVSCLSCAMYFVKADTFAEKILRSFPQADRNSDGVLSEDEEAFVSQRVMQRYPQADQDGDGVLSETEKQELVQKVSQRGRKQRPSSPSRSGTNSQNAEAVLKQLGLKGELDIEYRKNTKQQRNRLDFIYPKTKVYERAPLFIYIHGGGNTGGTKNALYNKSSLILKELTESGIAVATIDYRVFGAGEELGFHQLFEGKTF